MNNKSEQVKKLKFLENIKFRTSSDSESSIENNNTNDIKTNTNNNNTNIKTNNNNNNNNNNKKWRNFCIKHNNLEITDNNLECLKKYQYDRMVVEYDN